MRLLLAILLIAAAADDNRQSSIDNLQSPTPPAPWQNPASWKSLRPGQTPDQVRRLLGDPAETNESPSLALWYYLGKSKHPKDGVVIFRKSRNSHTLDKILEPAWSTLPTWQKLQTDYRQALADARAAEQAARQQQAAAAAARRQAETQTQAADQQARVPKTINRQSSINNNQSKIPPAKPDKATQLSSRYFITIGISFFVIALIIAGSYGFRLFKT